MRVRKIAKQLKLFHKNVTFDKEGYPVCKYKVANHSAKTNYIMRMTRKHYFGLRNKYPSWFDDVEILYPQGMFLRPLR